MVVSVKVKTQAKEERVEEAADGSLTVRVKSKPLEGRANEAVILALAEHFKVSKSKVRLLKGRASRNKVFDIAI